MAIQTYSDLQAQIKVWAVKTDTPVADCITMAESRLNDDLRLRTMEIDEPLTSVAGSRFIALPDGYLEPLGLWIEWSYGREELTFIPAGITTIASASIPLYWTVDGSNIAFERPTDTAYSLTFRMLQKFALSDDAQTNWLLTNYPDAYLAACMIEAAAFQTDAELGALWSGKYEAIRDRIKAKEGRSRSKATLMVDPELRVWGRRTFNIARGY